MGNFYSYRIICYIIFNRNSLLCELIVQKLHISLQQEEENRAICTEPVIRGLDKPKTLRGFFERDRTRKKQELLKLKDMEKKMILTTGVNEKENIDFTELISKIGAWASEPVRLLGGYYSSVLERKLSVGQTWRLIEVQLAFFACIFPADLSVAVRLLAVAWLGSAATRCRKAMKK